MALNIHNKGLALLGGGALDWVNDTDIKCALLDADYAFDADHDFFNDVAAEEVTGSGYTQGGVSVTGKTLTISNASDNVVLDCNDIGFNTVTVTFKTAVIYQDTGVAATSPLLCSYTFADAQVVAASALTLQIPAGGLITIARPA